ncbi:MAG: replication factor C small subunit [Candidatus Diapherotrites archaeon]|nr:replication factor C small subunit [Candidatus Diapherotrites archaeon]
MHKKEFAEQEEVLPWVEKYRPKSLSEIIGHEEIIKRLKSYVDNKNVPNLLFTGPAGVGKTSAAVALARELFPKNFNLNFIELNASDDRGIDVVRNTIKDFARTLSFDSAFKIIFLDESDALTNDAQQALRRTMERYTKTCRFILSANYSSRIIEPIQSRCVVFRFKPLSARDIEKKIKEICKEENVSITESGLEALIYVSEGDLRKAINVLQAASSIDKHVSEKNIFSVSSRAKPEEVRQMINLAIEGKFLDSRDKLNILLYEYGMSGEDIVLQIYREILSMKELDDKQKIKLIELIAEYSFRIAEGANERIQIEALLAAMINNK